MSPSAQDSRIAKMKDGRTHLAHKAEHAVDLSSGAIVAVTLQAAGLGDTPTVMETLKEAQDAGRVGDRARGGGGGGRQGLPQRSGADRTASSVETDVYSGTGLGPGASAGPPGATTSEAEAGISGAQFRSHISGGRHAANAHTRQSNHPEAAPDPRGRVQPGVTGPSEVRHRQAENPAMGPKRAFVRLFGPIGALSGQNVGFRRTSAARGLTNYRAAAKRAEGGIDTSTTGC